MIFLRNKILLAFLGAAAHVSGKADDQCPSETSTSSDDTLIDCSNLSSSIDSIVSNLGGSSYSNAVVTQASDAFYMDVIVQYASATVMTSPTYVVQAQDKFDVQATVMFATHCGYKITPRSGGHSYIGISSCDYGDGPCIQLDARNLAQIDVVNGNQGKQLRVGPGVILEELALKFVEEDVFIPTGECTDVGVGGHQQTGGLSASWGRTFGYFAHHVESFEIVLPDGTLMVAETPKEDLTSALNDDIFYAVLGGASGSFGTIVETVFNTHKDKDYFAQYWEVNFLFDDNTFEGIVSMLKKFTEMVDDEDFKNDPRWNIEWTIVGSKTIYTQAFQPPTLPVAVPGFNFLQLDFTFVESMRGLKKEDKAKAEAQAIYETLVDACGSSCILLDTYFENTLPSSLATYFKEALFKSVYGKTGPISTLLSEVTLFDYKRFGVSPSTVSQGFPYQTAWQQGQEFPDGDSMEDILRAIEDLMPTSQNPSPTDAVFVVAQLVVLPGQLHAKSDIALPFQNDVYGIDVGAFDLTPGGVLGDFVLSKLGEVRNMVIAATGGEDHRMFWNPDVNPDLGGGDWIFYYDDEAKFDRLKEVKSCVDPNYVFDNGRMTMPLAE